MGSATEKAFRAIKNCGNNCLGPFVFLILLFMAHPAFPLDASPHRQLVISVVKSWDDFNASVFRFEQADGKWTRTGGRAPGVVGERGLAWDPAVPGRDARNPVKKEGDLRAPAGIFPLSGAMGFSPVRPPGASLPFRVIERGIHCVDDRESPYYNRIVSEKDLPKPAAELWHSSERMWEIPDLYRLLVLVDYNVSDPGPGDGSCIFMHVWRGEGRATAGCTAMAEGDLTEIVSWLKPEAGPALVQLPMEVYRQVWREWKLPAPELLDEGRAENHSLVDVLSAAQGVMVEMRYARSDNFTGKTIYDCGRCFLRKGTAEKVAKATKELREKGFSLKMWDCYRPLSVQKLFWSIVPDPRFVADPKKGSRHNRGTAVDVTLVDAAGRELEMPTGFDDFSSRAAHGAAGLPEAQANRRLLAETMERAGFRLLKSEWWHYDDPEGGGELLDVPFAELCR